MELNDWRSFQSLFYPRRKNSTLLPDRTNSALYGITHGGKFKAIVGNITEDFQDSLEQEVSVFQKENTTREFYTVEQKNLDEWLEASEHLPHFLDQEKFLREKINESLSQKSISTSGIRNKSQSQSFFQIQRPFLLEALEGWWARVFPSSYGIHLRLEGASGFDLLLIYRQGRLAESIRPTFSGMSMDRAKVDLEAAKYLSERYGVRVQGFSLSYEEWKIWSSGNGDPWRQIAFAVRSGRLKMAPFRWSIVGLIGLRAYFGL